MKAMTRKRLAACAGVSTKTLCRFIDDHQDELSALGYQPRNVLPPGVVEWLSENYGIDVSSYVDGLKT